MLIAGNWKMYKGPRETREFCDAFSPPEGVEAVLCPPFASLAAAVESGQTVFAQNVHWAPEGAYTGEVSAPMLLELGVNGVVLGHSERRRDNCESDRALQDKVPAALAVGLEPILCVGENESQRDSNETEGILTRQIEADLADVAEDQLAEVVIAYEPIWAIGTGRTATPEQAQEAIALIRSLIDARSNTAATAIRILYGGSVKPDNAAELISQPDVDGALVGGASLDPADFAAIVEAAA